MKHVHKWEREREQLKAEKEGVSYSFSTPIYLNGMVKISLNDFIIIFFLISTII